jgi:hypothetical protein
VGYGRYARFFYVDRLLMVFDLHASGEESDSLSSHVPCYFPASVSMVVHFVGAEVQSSASTLVL